MTTSGFRIPNLVVAWPWLRAVNPHMDQTSQNSSSWLENFHAYPPATQENFNRCDFGLLAALTYPIASKEHLRTGTDFMNLLFFIDEITEIGDETFSTEVLYIAMDALRNPSKLRPKGEHVVGEITRQFWERSIPHITATSHRRFVCALEAYLKSNVVQARDRSSQHIRRIEEYFSTRRDNIGTKPAFVLLELGLDIPDCVMTHPSIQSAVTSLTDMLIIANDVFSFKVEHSRDDDANNVLKVVMCELRCNLARAIEWADERNQQLRTTFLSSIAEVPSWGGQVDIQVSEYLYGLANWVRANECWSFESQRYFGTHGPTVQKDRWVSLDCGHPQCITGGTTTPRTSYRPYLVGMLGIATYALSQYGLMSRATLLRR
uniref:Terpene synthase n=1 Tax=Clitopilus sp. TaxID=1967123 RepID=A0A4P2VRB6_9AGAR|nr:putative sesquiterpene synthase [Clitopilus sp.]